MINTWKKEGTQEWLAGWPPEVSGSSYGNNIFIDKSSYIPIMNNVLISAAETCTKPVQQSLQSYSRHALSLI